ncbi:MAG: hypothetical protein HRU15_09970, partial [Planctomycetes bacterium]|nr:hypothetical protein [Planctomycetota bacterium]
MGLFFFHASIRNEMKKIRFTCDVRFQPAADPIDDRWVGEDPESHSPWEDNMPMEEAREMWGV